MTLVKDDLQKAIDAENAGQWVQALQCYRAILVQNPNHQEALLGCGRLSDALGFKHHALDFFHQVLVQDQKSVKAWVGRGATYLHLGLWKQAQRDFLRALTLDPHHAEALLFLAQLEGLCGNLDSAMHYLERGLKDHPHDLDLILERALLLLKALPQGQSLEILKQDFEFLYAHWPEDPLVQGLDKILKWFRGHEHSENLKAWLLQCEDWIEELKNMPWLTQRLNISL